MLKHPALTEARIRLALPQMEAAIYSAGRPIQVSFWEVHGEPVSYEEAKEKTFQPCEIGQPWGGLWDTAWFRCEGVVPAEWKNAEVVVRMLLTRCGREGFTAEGLIYKEGAVVRAINVNRREILIAEKAVGGESWEFYVEAAANGGVNEAGVTTGMCLPDYDGTPGFRLEQAEMVTVNREAFDFFYDYKVALEAMETLPENSQRRGELRYALNESLNQWDRDDKNSTGVARECLRTVLARKNGVGGHQISAVGHAHIDTAWLWPLRETIRKCARTFSTALDYMEKYPDYIFVCSQAQQYAWMKEYYPEIWKKIQAAVRRGQWEPVGSMWIEVDCNLASGESLIRQILHGKRFFKEELGYETRDAWIPDVFGYAASMPQIMRKSGIDYFLTQKISWNQFNKFPHHTFDWEGIDGTRIFTHFPPADTYNADTGPSELIRSENNFKEHDRATRSLLAFGWGDGGGGPSIEMLEKARRVQDLDGVPKLKMESALTFFSQAQAEIKDLPVWVGELYLELHRGTYTAQAKNKLGNRKSELLLRDAEFFDAITMALVPNRNESAADPARAVYDVTGRNGDGANTHRNALERAWKLVLLNQFHDIIPGSSIHWVYQDSARDYATIRTLGESVRDSALNALAPLVDTAGFEKPVLLLNTLGFSRREVIEKPDGSFAHLEVPACGYRVVELSDTKDSANAVTIEYDNGSIVLANGLVRLTIDSEGYVSSLLDLQAGREVCAARGNAFQLHNDVPNAFDAWDVDIFYKEKTTAIDGLESMEVTIADAAKAAVRIVRRFGKSRIEQQIIVRMGSFRVDFQTTVDWQESQKLLKVAFPVAIRATNARYEIQYGHVERPTHANTSWDMARFEVCAQKWADLSETGYGVALLNDCKYGYEICGNVMRLSLLTASISPDPVADRGTHHFTYSVLPHRGDFIAGRVQEEAAMLNAPIIVRTMPRQGGSLPNEQSFFAVDNSRAIIEAVKISEDGAAIIVRFYESQGGRGPVTLHTLLQPKSVSLVNLLEEEPQKIAFDGQVKLDLMPFEIVTLRLEF